MWHDKRNPAEVIKIICKTDYPGWTAVNRRNIRKIQSMIRIQLAFAKGKPHVKHEKKYGQCIEAKYGTY